jgi:hypothetical protein
MIVNNNQPKVLEFVEKLNDLFNEYNCEFIIDYDEYYKTIEGISIDIDYGKSTIFLPNEKFGIDWDDCADILTELKSR